MSTYRLENLFEPRSVALVGASPREGRWARRCWRICADGGFPGALHLVNPHHREIEGRPCLASLAEIGSAVDVVIIVTPKGTVPAAHRRGGAARLPRGDYYHRRLRSRPRIDRRADRPNGPQVRFADRWAELPRRHRAKAKFVPASRRLPRGGRPRPDLPIRSDRGRAARMGAQRDVGFSARVTWGQDRRRFWRLLDFRAGQGTRAILLYVESIKRSRKFMSAARAARAKPVVVVKSGRHPGRARPLSHTGALAGSDAVFDAAFRRAGLLRVYVLDELFAAVETLSRVAPFPAIAAVLTNGGGLGVLAVDRLADLGGRLATLCPHQRSLAQVMPAGWTPQPGRHRR